nr:hypothetical protein [Alteromonas macleodii]|tara:strand:+ start:1102 stop:1443 length:342 start_codon:yes stop_codon:yes gene_type:complete
MSLLSKILFGFCDSGRDYTNREETSETLSVNPVTGLPLLKNSGIDVAGNPIGTNLSETADSAQSGLYSAINSENCLSDSGSIITDEHQFDSDSFDDSFSDSYDSFDSFSDDLG